MKTENSTNRLFSAEDGNQQSRLAPVISCDNIEISIESILRMNRQQLGEIYALEIERKLPMEHYANLNQILLTKYKSSGLNYIKELAWSILAHNQIDKSYFLLAQRN